MPQGGAGKCGGNLMSSGNSKKKMKKPRYTTSKVSKKVGGNDDDDDGVAHTVFRPSQETRALVVRAQRALLEAERKARVVRGGKKSGQRLGGDSTGDEEGNVREARLRHLEQQQQQAKATKAHYKRIATLHTTSGASTSSTLDAAAGRARRKAFEDAHVGDVVAAEVLLMLDLLSERLLQDRAALVDADVHQIGQTMCTVLRNAAANGAADADPKYRTLRAENDKLWSRLLCHHEPRAILSTAGFEMQRTHTTGWAAPEAASELMRGSAANPGIHGFVVPSFIESEFTTKVEYEGWLRGAKSAAACASNDGSAVAAATDADLQAAAQAERESEMQAVHIALAEQLDGAVPPEADVIESLLSRLQELSVVPGSVDDVAADEGADEHQERAFELVHPGAASAEAVEDLEAALAAATVFFSC